MKAIITVIGKDQVGIIAGITTLLSANQVNVLDISQTVMEGDFTMTMLVDASACSLPFAELVTLLEAEGAGRGLTIHAQREDIFNAMHRI